MKQVALLRAREVDRWIAKELKARAELDRLDAEWQAHVDRESARFGRPVPSDPEVLDILAQIDIEPGDVWRWKGLFNNKALPTYKVRSTAGRSERSVVRMLSVAFGLIEPGDGGLLYPIGDKDDVNPWHRRHRIGTNRQMGNPHRYEQGKAKAS